MTQSQEFELSNKPQHPTTSTSLQGGSGSYKTSTSMEAARTRETPPHKIHHHRDCFKRPSKSERGYDKFLNPYDGRLCDLVVQSSTAVLNSTSHARWRRINIGNGSPWMIRIANWAMSRDHGSEETVQTDVGKAIQRWIPASLALAVIVGLKCVKFGGLVTDIPVSDQPSHPCGRHSIQFR